MRALVNTDSSTGFQATAFALAAAAKLTPSSRLPRPPFAEVRAWSSALEGTRRRRLGCHRHSWMLASSAEAESENTEFESSGVGDTSGEPNAIEKEGSDYIDANAGGSGDPLPRQDEQMTGEENVTAPVSLASPEDIDWDAAWADTRRKIEEDRRSAPAFSGRKQVIATKNADGEYDYVEISADGSRRRRGDGGGGFEFSPDSPGDADANRRFRDREGEIVDLATTNKVWCEFLFYLMHERGGVM